MPTRALGRTSERVSMLGLGGYHIGQPEEAEALRIMDRAIEHGLTFFDNCWDYNSGESERRMGKALRGAKRDKVFLMSKIDGRKKAVAARQIDQSLERLATDRVDLMQIHEVIRDSDPAEVFGPDGAIEALLSAQKAGKIRYIGFTGHKHPKIHLNMLKTAADHGVRFDTVQMPLNVMDPHYASFERSVLPVLVEQQIGVLGMKPLGAGIVLQSGVVDARECLRYSLSLPTSVVITGIDSMAILEQALDVARDFEPLDDDARRALLARTAPHGRDGGYEKFKTSSMFDGTIQHPHWLTEARL